MSSLTEKKMDTAQPMSMASPEPFEDFLHSLGINLTTDPYLQEALTHASTGHAINHERLEFLGDAVLRLAATEYIDKFHSTLSVGQRSQLRAHLVSDHWLAQLGESIQVDSMMHLGSSARNDALARDTLRAETTEALIGAVYLQQRNLECIHRWLTPHWQITANDVLGRPIHFNSKSLLQEWSQGRGLGLPVYTTEEKSHEHGDPRRFSSIVQIPGHLLQEGWGASRKEAEQRAAEAALQELDAGC